MLANPIRMVFEVSITADKLELPAFSDRIEL